MGTRALITGIGGFAGYHLANLLLKEGYEVSGFDRCTEDADRVKALGSKIRYLCADITSLEEVERAIQEAHPDVVFHLAGISHVGETWKKRRLTFEVNFLGTMNVLDTLRKFCRKAVAVLVGSGEQYGNVPLERQPIREEEPLFPRSPYGVSKAAQELLGRQYAASDWMEVVLIRAFNHFGAFQEPTFVTSDFARQIAQAEAGRREPVLRVGNLDVRRDFTDVRDMVRGYMLASQRGRSGDIFNLSSGRSVLLSEVVETLRNMAKTPIAVMPESDRFRPVDIPILSGDNSKAHNELGWVPEIPFSDTLKWILDYWRAQVSA
jgi:GDP-4-dehydro-6-deoxy-D-mannose reductase